MGETHRIFAADASLYAMVGCTHPTRTALRQEPAVAASLPCVSARKRTGLGVAVKPALRVAWAARADRMRFLTVFGPIRRGAPSMDELELLGRITVNPRVFGGKPIIRGRRLAVEHVLAMLAAGDTPETILEGFPWLEAEDVARLSDLRAKARGAYAWNRL